MNKSLQLKVGDNIVCHSCEYKTENKTQVLRSLKYIGGYDYEEKEYENDTYPVSDAWEVIVSGDKEYIIEKENSIQISKEGLYFFCPDCVAELDTIK